MGATSREPLKLPDQLLVRYFRAGEIERVRKVTVGDGEVVVTIGDSRPPRVDRWRDLGGGLGFVPV